MAVHRQASRLADRLRRAWREPAHTPHHRDGSARGRPLSSPDLVVHERSRTRVALALGRLRKNRAARVCGLWADRPRVSVLSLWVVLQHLLAGRRSGTETPGSRIAAGLPLRNAVPRWLLRRLA